MGMVQYSPAVGGGCVWACLSYLSNGSQQNTSSTINRMKAKYGENVQPNTIIEICLELG